MSQLKLNILQIGSNADPTKNFIIKTPAAPDGSLEIRRGNYDAPGALVAKINADGGVSNLGPAFSATCNTTPTIPVTTYTKVPFQVEEFDTANCYDNTTNYRFQPNVAGYYLITAGVGFTTGEAVLAIYKNGAAAKQGEPAKNLTNIAGVCTISALIYLNGSTDYVEMFFYTGAGSATLTANPSVTYFQGHLVRAA